MDRHGHEKQRKKWTDVERDERWNKRCDELKDFLGDPELGGCGALRKRNKHLSERHKSLAKWAETNKPLFQNGNWTKDPRVNGNRLKKLLALNFPGK